MSIAETFERANSEKVFVKQEPMFEYDDGYSLIEGQFTDNPDELVEDGSEGNYEEEIGVKMEMEESEHEFIGFSEQSPSKSAIDESVFCDKCSKRCASQLKMEIHMVAEHSGTDGPFECPVCFKTYANKAGLFKHANNHDPNRNFLCPR